MSSRRRWPIFAEQARLQVYDLASAAAECLTQARQQVRSRTRHEETHRLLREALAAAEKHDNWHLVKLLIRRAADSLDDDTDLLQAEVAIADSQAAVADIRRLMTEAKQGRE
jgi:transcriptional regulator of NAD metabolism